MRWDRGSLGTQFSRQKTGGDCQRIRSPAILSVPNKPLFRLFILLSGAELTEYYSVHSGIRIGPKRTRPQLFNQQNSIYLISGYQFCIRPFLILLVTRVTSHSYYLWLIHF